MKRTFVFAGALLAATFPARATFADPVNIVAAENFYGDVAAQVGADNVAVTSILSNPDEDPHLFEASASTAKALANAKIVIVNGADYDPWMTKLLSANKAQGRREILVATLAHKKSGDNPHLWYNPATMKALANALSVDLSIADPAHRSQYQKAGAVFASSLEPLEAKIAEMRKKYAGQSVAASEPVFGYMAELLGLVVQDEKFATAVMNNTEPSASDVAAFEDDLKGRKVRVMLYNAQASEPAVQRLVQIARDEKVPVVGVTETEPKGRTYQQWMLEQLEALDKALAGQTS
ncbi:MAG TPA: zinc ABC transporter substrate-binding protein [Roseiarcus sp.]|nr:zinc ABC transporter substrate-binding protein [Roseiarcus sp.]